jgi:hypothetical protein
VLQGTKASFGVIEGLHFLPKLTWLPISKGCMSTMLVMSTELRARVATGNLYGSAEGYNYPTGTVFKLDTSEIFAVLSDFGDERPASLVMDRANLYRTKIVDGTRHFGTIFVIKMTH